MQSICAWIEPHNEANISDFPLGAENDKAHTEAVAFLRDRHPDIVVSASFTGLTFVSRGTTDNSQLYDMHMYVGAEHYNSFWRKTIRRENCNCDNPLQDEFLKDLLEPEITPYSAFKNNWHFHSESRVFGSDGWLKQLWTYYNLNSEFGLEYYDYLTDLAIINDLWAFAFSTYNCPAMPVWWACPKWLAETNNRFLRGIVKGKEAGG